MDAAEETIRIALDAYPAKVMLRTISPALAVSPFGQAGKVSAWTMGH